MLSFHDLIGPTYVADDRDFSDAIQDVKPDSNVLSSVGDCSSHFTHELVRVNPNLEDVVGESKERSQRERSNEDSDEAELENCGYKRTKTIINTLKSFDFHKCDFLFQELRLEEA